MIQMNYIDLGRTEPARVTFEAENNLDFRLGTAPLRYTKLAARNDLAAISRIGEEDYELRIIPSNAPEYATLLPYAITYIGSEGKRYGYIDNVEFERAMGIALARRANRPPTP